MPFHFHFGNWNIILSWLGHAALHGGDNLPDGGDVLERVRGEEDDVRPFARFQGTHVGLLAHAHGADEGGGTQSVHRRHADFGNEDFDFALQGWIGIFGGREAVGAGGNEDALFVGLAVSSSATKLDWFNQSSCAGANHETGSCSPPLQD